MRRESAPANKEEDERESGQIDNGNEIVDGEDEDHGDEVGDEDVVSRVRQICPQVCGAELGHQHLVIIMKSGQCSYNEGIYMIMITL